MILYYIICDIILYYIILYYIILYYVISHVIYYIIVASLGSVAATYRESTEVGESTRVILGDIPKGGGAAFS